MRPHMVLLWPKRTGVRGKFEGFGHANIAMPRLYDPRGTRPEDRPTFMAAY